MDYLDDLEADFLAIYKVEDMMGLPSARFFRLAERLTAFQGVLQARALQEEQDRKEGKRPLRPTTPAGERQTLREVGGEAVAVSSDQTSYLAERLKDAP